MPPLTVAKALAKAKVDDPTHVRQLNVCGLQVSSISALQGFKNLEVCVLSANDVSDLSGLQHCRRLKQLHIRRNNIDDLQQLLYLSNLPDLKTLSAKENPIEQHPHYRPFAIAAMSALEKLDDELIESTERRAAEKLFPDVFASDLHQTHRSLSPPSVPDFEEEAPVQAAPKAQRRSPFRGEASDTSTPDRGRQSSAYGNDDQPVGGGAARRPASHPADPARNFGGGYRRGFEEKNDRHVDPPVSRRPHTARHESPRFAAPPEASSRRPPMPKPRPHDEDDYGFAPRFQPREYQDPHDFHPRDAYHHFRDDGRARRPQHAVQEEPRGTYREENAVRAVNILLNDMSPASLRIVQNHLNMLIDQR